LKEQGLGHNLNSRTAKLQNSGKNKSSLVMSIKENDFDEED